MKITTKNNYPPNFGLRVQTHRVMGEHTVKNTDILINNEELKNFLYYVQKPDFDETGLKLITKQTCNKHFFYPPETFRPALSHLDFDGKHNAFSRFTYHVTNFLSALKNKNRETFVEESARAKHFLDDMSVGFHVKRGTAWQKYKEEKVHREFETFVMNNQYDLLKNYTKSELPAQNKCFKDLFLNTVNTSLKNEIPTINNKAEWKNIAQKTINLNIDASKEFFRLIQNL